MCDVKDGRKGKINERKQQTWESNKCFINPRKTTVHASYKFMGFIE
jgi:hypothetical protein